MRGVHLLMGFMAFRAFAQPAEAMTEAQHADYRKRVGAENVVLPPSLAK